MSHQAALSIPIKQWLLSTSGLFSGQIHSQTGWSTQDFAHLEIPLGTRAPPNPWHRPSHWCFWKLHLYFNAFWDT